MSWMWAGSPCRADERWHLGGETPWSPLSSQPTPPSPAPLTTNAKRVLQLRHRQMSASHVICQEQLLGFPYFFLKVKMGQMRGWKQALGGGRTSANKTDLGQQRYLFIFDSVLFYIWERVRFDNISLGFENQSWLVEVEIVSILRIEASDGKLPRPQYGNLLEQLQLN